jgi:microsomal dipeptidase-like Zn-dependent dipeptidase
MPFFDFHCHPGLKPQFSDPANKPSPWDNIDAKLKIFKDIKISINKLFNEVLNSQSSLTQLVQSDVKLIGVILHAPEKKIGQALSEKKIVNKGNINLISTKQLAYLAEGTHSFDLISTELQSLKTALSPANLNGASFKIINSETDFKENSDNTIYGVIIVEGSHCFFNDPNAPDAKRAFTQNLEQFTNDNTVLAMNICHMQQNPFCNHAYGIQFFNPGYFYPTGKGITNWGHELIETLSAKKILTDIKHMSVQSRIDLYLKLQDPNDTSKFIQPIICTHAGTTGLSMNDKVKYLYSAPEDKGSVYEVVYLKPKSIHDGDAYHNCSSINLYDEDINNILLSEGIIGLSFDQRILGYADESVIPDLTTPHDMEYISHDEALAFLGPNPAGLKIWTDDDAIWTAEDFAAIEPVMVAEIHRKFLINNIVHILWVANKNPGIGATGAAKQICIGTDFDGLINAIDCCKETTGLKQLKADMQDEMKTMLSKAGIGNIDTAQLLEDIFYNNGKNFVLNRLRVMNRP